MKNAPFKMWLHLVQIVTSSIYVGMDSLSMGTILLCGLGLLISLDLSLALASLNLFF